MQTDNIEEDDEWDFGNIFAEIHDGKRHILSAITWGLGEFMCTVREKGRKAANMYRATKNLITKKKIDGTSPSSI
jgi:hypothetical protein